MAAWRFTVIWRLDDGEEGRYEVDIEADSLDTALEAPLDEDEPWLKDLAADSIVAVTISVEAAP